jgi:hypothetical protein
MTKFRREQEAIKYVVEEQGEPMAVFLAGLIRNADRLLTRAAR